MSRSLCWAKRQRTHRCSKQLLSRLRLGDGIAAMLQPIFDISLSAVQHLNGVRTMPWKVTFGIAPRLACRPRCAVGPAALILTALWRSLHLEDSILGGLANDVSGFQASSLMLWRRQAARLPSSTYRRFIIMLHSVLCAFKAIYSNTSRHHMFRSPQLVLTCNFMDCL